MAKGSVGPRWLAGCLAALNLLWGGSVWAGSLPTVQQMLQFRPKQEGVVYYTPTAQEESGCKVELVSGGHQGSGYLLRGPNGQPLRRFYNTRFTNVNDKTKIDVWSYYNGTGVEVYREWATQNGSPADQFRWMNAGGSKWGVDTNGDGKIDAWKMISAEEVSQEVLQAVITKDVARLQALQVSDAELKALNLPGTEAARLRQVRGDAATKFQEIKLPTLTKETRWVHLETTAAPQCLIQEQPGAADVLRYSNAVILCDTNGKNEWLQTGELIQVGSAWRLVGAPSAGLPEDIASPQAGPGTSLVTDKELQELLGKLKDLDAKLKARPEPSGADAEAVQVQLQRADLLEKIVAKVKPEERDPWIRQIADCLSTAAQATPATAEATAFQRLQTLEKQIDGAMAGSSLAAYVTFREMTADYAMKIARTPSDFAKVQEAWLERLAKFVQSYPKAEDTPDALLQLGMVSEFLNKEIEAKKWYQQLAASAPDSPLANKARGASRRLDLEGKPLELASPKLEGGSFDITSLQGKFVVVYYWASWNQQCVGDFAKLKLLLDTYSSKGVELVTVNLDTTSDEATNFLKKSPAPGTHLFQAGGLDSPLAVQYGIMGLPNLFLVNKDGKVASRTVQITTLEDELKKLLK